MAKQITIERTALATDSRGYPIELSTASIDEAIAELRTYHYASVDVGEIGALIIDNLVARIDAFYDDGDKTPEEAEQERMRYTRDDMFAGHRPIGAANSGTEATPNLNKSVVWRPGLEFPGRERAPELDDALKQWFRLSSAVFIPIALRIQQELGGNQELLFDRLSLSQANYYPDLPKDLRPEMYQSIHDDQDWGTVIAATDKGLEALDRNTGELRKITFRRGRVGVFLGKIMEEITDGNFLALWHQVRNLSNPDLPPDEQVHGRKALMSFFYGEAVNGPTELWVPRRSIDQLNVESNETFGGERWDPRVLGRMSLRT